MKKRLLSLVLALLLCVGLLPSAALGDSDAVAIDETNFPDETFRSYVSTSFDTDGDGYLSATEIASVTTIDVENTDCADLTGIEYFTALKYLPCNNTNVTTLDVSNNTELKYLNCSGTKLTTLDVSKNTALEQLWCANNKLKVLDLTADGNMVWLNCENNQLTSLDISSCNGEYPPETQTAR